MGTLLLLQQYTFEALGPMYISALLRQNGHNCILFIEHQEKNFIDSIKRAKPDLIGFTVFTGQQDWALKYAELIKKELSVPIIMGGPHVVHNPDIIEKHDFIDFICRGEGEYATLDLMNGIQNGSDLTKIENLWMRKNGEIYKNDVRHLADPDGLPFPDRELYYRYPVFYKSTVKRFITGRGCPFRCVFCHNHLDLELYRGKGEWARKRSPEKVIEEIENVRDRYPLRTVDFSPDDFFLNRHEWALEFLEMYRERINMPFLINTRPETVNERIARALKMANCRGVAISVESADEYLRNNVLKKNTKEEDIRNAVKCLKEHKITIKTYNMIGIPNETLEQAFKTLQLNVELKPKWARCAILYPYPNTALWKYGVERKILDPNLTVEDFKDNYMEECLFDVPHKNKLINLQRFFSICVQFPFLIPVIKNLIKLPPNKFFDIIGVLSFGIFGVRYFGHGFGDIVRTAYKFLRTNQPI